MLPSSLKPAGTIASIVTCHDPIARRLRIGWRHIAEIAPTVALGSLAAIVQPVYCSKERCTGGEINQSSELMA
jgi:hypothetical protein